VRQQPKQKKHALEIVVNDLCFGQEKLAHHVASRFGRSGAGSCGCPARCCWHRAHVRDGPTRRGGLRALQGHPPFVPCQRVALRLKHSLHTLVCLIITTLMAATAPLRTQQCFYEDVEESQLVTIEYQVREGACSSLPSPPTLPSHRQMDPHVNTHAYFILGHSFPSVCDGW